MWGTRSQHFDTLSLSANQATDVCVVGAGLAGLFCSVLLAEGGARVTVVDADPQLLGRGGSARESGGVHLGVVEHPYRLVQALGEERAKQLYAHSKRSLELLRERANFEETGGLWVALDQREEGHITRSAAALERMGVASFVMEPDHVSQRIGASSCGSGLLVKEEGLVHPLVLLETLTREAISGGVSFVPGFAVEAIEEDEQGMRVCCADGRVVCAEVVVLAAGAWSGEVSPWLKDKVVPVREQALQTKPLPVSVKGPSRLGYGYTNLRQLSDGGLLISGCRWASSHMELGETDDGQLVSRIQDKLLASLHRFYPGCNLEVVGRWAWLYARTCDLLPIVGPLPGQPRMIVCTGFVGNPYGLAPAAAEAVAEGLLREDAARVPDFISALRFV